MSVKMIECPMHKERTPSCAFYDDGYKTHWHCFHRSSIHSAVGFRVVHSVNTHRAKYNLSLIHI